MITCDLCGNAVKCTQKEIDGREYDICPDCWKPIAQKLKGKGRVIADKTPETVLLPSATESEREMEKPVPGSPPTIWGLAPPVSCPEGTAVQRW